MRAALQQSLPGETAQFLMAPVNRARAAAARTLADKYRPSAVLILLCEDGSGDLFIPLIERMPYDGVHSAQISLPGGKFEQADLDLQQTALRECYEEIGISDIEMIGPLTELHIPVSNFLVQPYVGICRVKDPLMVPHEREVKAVLKLKIRTLLARETEEQGTIQVNNEISIRSSWYNVDGHKVWGATAMILSELKEVCKTIF